MTHSCKIYYEVDSEDRTRSSAFGEVVDAINMLPAVGSQKRQDSLEAPLVL